MNQTKNIVFVLFTFLVGGIVTFNASVADAQPASLTIDSSTGMAPAPPSTAAPGSAAPQASSGGGGGNMYYGEYLDDADIDDGGSTFGGVVPRTHTVVTGDTLWDLSAYYFTSAWDWPKVWKLNPEIEDPHWIYPGNVVRLREGGEDQTQVVAMNLKLDNGAGSAKATITPKRGYGLRQTAYVDLKDLEDAGKVSGSIDEKSLLSTGDSVYVSYGKELPKVGTVFSVYGTGTKIRRGGDVVGAYVEVAGELRITFAKEGKRARAVITRSVNPIERGMRVGPLELNFDNTDPVKSNQKVDGTLVGLIGPDELIGAEAAVIIDRGTADGVTVGNRFLVIRRGDAYQKVMEPGTNVGQDDGKYPARAIGEILVLQTGEKACLGVVSFSIHEFGIGDQVFMRKGQ